MENNIKVIECEGMQIALSAETFNTQEHPIYFPSNLLFYIPKGELNILLDQEKHTFSKGSFGLIRKYTNGTCHKNWTKQEGAQTMYAFVLQDEFIKTALKELQYKVTQPATTKRILQLKENQILKGLMKSVETYVQEEESLDKELVALKTKEALLAIIKHNPEYAAIFAEFTTSERANLVNFMNNTYFANVNLETLARMSGRSLSTFHREFKMIFNETPHKWIKKKRLQHAYQLLKESNNKISEIYIQSGFEDLAHFSRSFKKEFGITPTAYRKSLE